MLSVPYLTLSTWTLTLKFISCWQVNTGWQIQTYRQGMLSFELLVTSRDVRQRGEVSQPSRKRFASSHGREGRKEDLPAPHHLTSQLRLLFRDKTCPSLSGTSLHQLPLPTRAGQLVPPGHQDLPITSGVSLWGEEGPSKEHKGSISVLYTTVTKPSMMFSLYIAAQSPSKEKATG